MGTKLEGQHNTVKGASPRIVNHLALLTGIGRILVFPCYCMRRENGLNLLYYHISVNQSAKAVPKALHTLIMS